MVWSNWQGAIWRGAILVMLCWSGLAWTQTSAPKGNDADERIMVVHQNGRKTRCRVLESWQLPDNRIAHLLQAVESGEMITIVDDTTPSSPSERNARGQSKRIFAWGIGSKTPPEGSPIPPRSRPDAGISIDNEVKPPMNPSFKEALTIVNMEDKEGTRAEVKTADAKKPAEPQVIDYKNAPSVHMPPPEIFNKQPQLVEIPGVPAASRPPLFPRVNGLLAKPTTETIIINNATPTAHTTPAPAAPMPVATQPGNLISTSPATEPMPRAAATGPIKTTYGPPIIIHETEIPAKRSWRPGDVLFGWMQKPAAPVIVKSEIVKYDGAMKPSKTDEFLAKENKIAEKRIAERMDKLPKAPFSTAMSQPAESKKSDAALPAIVKSQDEKPGALPGLKNEPKSAAKPHDMFGASANDAILPPGKSLFDSTGLKPEIVKLPPAPTARTNDPLASPERLIPNDDKFKPKAVLGPVMGDRLPDMAPRGLPVGTQSVLAARSGLQGPVTFVPVPTVTVPQPNHPPMPPAPMMPDAPQLNAYVNAFTPPPAPKTPMQAGASGMPQWMQPHPAVMQQQMMQQQLMQQQMYQQQMLMAQGYMPNPHMMPPAQAMPSQGPMSNGARHYTGPMPPNPFGTSPMMPAGYVPAPYGPMMPAPVQPMQPVSYQQVPTQQAAVTQHVEQLIKAMRESPYPSQREMAAHSLTSFEWRAHPQIVPAMLATASQDPASSVRAGCINCLGRMGAAIEPVFGTLHSMRNDIDPRVRQEVEQAFGRLGQTPMAPQ